jgi:hypothetical protein
MARVLLCYKNFAANQNISHIGLGVSALCTAKVLKAHGIQAEVHAILSAHDITALLKAPARDGQERVSHVCISAPWISSNDIAGILLRPWPEVEFAVNVHSNVGFLQADPNGVRLIKQYIDLEQGGLNFKVSANSRKGALWLREAFQCPAAYLPNLYFVDYSHVAQRPLWRGGKLYIGSFGAQRPLKNLMSAAGAALVVASSLKADVEFFINAGRQEGGGNTVVSSIREMVSGCGHIGLNHQNWLPWSAARDLVRRMHVLINPSYTESFNMVTADGVAEGVPSVTSDAIDWVPDYWQVSADETMNIARTAIGLINNPKAAADGLRALENHNSQGLDSWGSWVGFAQRYNSIVRDPWLL